MKIRVTAKDGGKAVFHIRKQNLSLYKQKYEDLEIIDDYCAKKT